MLAYLGVYYFTCTRAIILQQQEFTYIEQATDNNEDRVASAKRYSYTTAGTDDVL